MIKQLLVSLIPLAFLAVTGCEVASEPSKNVDASNDAFKVVDLVAVESQEKPRMKLVIILDESASMKVNAFDKLKTVLTKLTSDLKGYNYDLDFYTTTLFFDSYVSHWPSIRNSLVPDKKLKDSSGYEFSFGLVPFSFSSGSSNFLAYKWSVPSWSGGFPQEVHTQFSLDTKPMGGKSFVFNEDMSMQEIADLRDDLFDWIDAIPGTGSVEQGLIAAGFALSSQNASYASGSVKKPERVFSDKYVGGAIIFISDEDNNDAQDKNFPVSMVSIPSQKKISFTPTFRKNVTTLRIRPKQYAIRDGIVVTHSEDVFAAYDFIGAEASSFPMYLDSSGQAKYCSDAMSSKSLMFPQPGYSGTSSSGQLNAVKAAILAKYPSANLASMTNYEAFCYPIGSEVQDSNHGRFEYDANSIDNSVCANGVLSADTTPLQAKVSHFLQTHWLYSNGATPTWDLVVGSSCSTGISFVEQEQSRVSLVKSLMPNASGASSLSDAILSTLENNYGDGRMLLGGVLLTSNSKKSCSPQGTVGSQYISLIEKHLEKNPDLGFVHDLCKANSFTLAGDRLGTYIQDVALGTYDISGELSSVESVSKIVIVRGNKEFELNANQFSVSNDGMLSIRPGLVRKYDIVRIQIVPKI